MVLNGNDLSQQTTKRLAPAGGEDANTAKRFCRVSSLQSPEYPGWGLSSQSSLHCVASTDGSDAKRRDKQKNVHFGIMTDQVLTPVRYPHHLTPFFQHRQDRPDAATSVLDSVALPRDRDSRQVENNVQLRNEGNTINPASPENLTQSPQPPASPSAHNRRHSTQSPGIALRHIKNAYTIHHPTQATSNSTQTRSPTPVIYIDQHNEHQRNSKIGNSYSNARKQSCLGSEDRMYSQDGYISPHFLQTNQSLSLRPDVSQFTSSLDTTTHRQTLGFVRRENKLSMGSMTPDRPRHTLPAFGQKGIPPQHLTMSGHCFPFPVQGHSNVIRQGSFSMPPREIVLESNRAFQPNGGSQYAAPVPADVRWRQPMPEMRQVPDMGETKHGLPSGVENARQRRAVLEAHQRPDTTESFRPPYPGLAKTNSHVRAPVANEERPTQPHPVFQHLPIRPPNQIPRPVELVANPFLQVNKAPRHAPPGATKQEYPPMTPKPKRKPTLTDSEWRTLALRDVNVEVYLPQHPSQPNECELFDDGLTNCTDVTVRHENVARVTLRFQWMRKNDDGGVYVMYRDKQSRMDRVIRKVTDRRKSVRGKKDATVVVKIFLKEGRKVVGQ